MNFNASFGCDRPCCIAYEKWRSRLFNCMGACHPSACCNSGSQPQGSAVPLATAQQLPVLHPNRQANRKNTKTKAAQDDATSAFCCKSPPVLCLPEDAETCCRAALSGDAEKMRQQCAAVRSSKNQKVAPEFGAFQKQVSPTQASPRAARGPAPSPPRSARGGSKETVGNASAREDNGEKKHFRRPEKSRTWSAQQAQIRASPRCLGISSPRAPGADSRRFSKEKISPRGRGRKGTDDFAEKPESRIQIPDTPDTDSDDSQNGQAALLVDDSSPFAQDVAAGNIEGAFLIACYIGDEDAIKQFLEAGVDNFTADTNGYSAALHAGLSGNLGAFKAVMEYNPSDYGDHFDCYFTASLMTPLMLLLLHGHTQIYEYLFEENHFECKLRLLSASVPTMKGQTFKKGQTAGEDDGMNEPLDRWLDFLPELTLIENLPKRPAVQTTLRRYEEQKQYTEADFLQLQKQRMNARNFIRLQLSKDKGEKPQPKTRFDNKRGALVEGMINLFASKTDKTDGTVHRRGKKKQTLRNILLKNRKDEQEVSRSIESEDGEVWDNDGHEFQAEQVVLKLFPLFKGSPFWFLERHELRELLRIVVSETVSQGDVLFKAGSRIDAVYALRHGTVECSFNARGSKTLSVEDPAESGSGDQHPGIQIIDIEAFTDFLNASQTATATVTSPTATVLVFRRNAILESGEDMDPRFLTTNGLKKQILHQSPMLRFAFTDDEFKMVAKQLNHMHLDEGFRLFNPGQPVAQLYIIQQGEIFVKEGSKTKMMHIGPNAQGEFVKGEDCHRYMVFGARQILLSLVSPVEVAVNSGCTTAWALEEKACNSVLPLGSDLVRGLEIGACTLYLSRLMIFKKLKLSDPRLRKLVLRSEMKYFVGDDTIMVQGEEGDSIFMIIEGTLGIVVNGVEVAKLAADIDHSKVQFFGELAVLEDAPRTATICVRSHSATALRIDEASISHVFGSVEALLNEQGVTAADIIVATKNKIKGKSDQPDALDVEIVGTLEAKRGADRKSVV